MNSTLAQQPYSKITRKPSSELCTQTPVPTEVIQHSKFSVFKAFMEAYNKTYAMKFFPQENQRATESFQRESRFITLVHPNIVSIFESKKDYTFTNPHGKIQKGSYVLMEYAPYGDFADLALEEYLVSDEKLVRTFFHQLIQGLEYMHKKGIAHTDLKLENLLLGEGFELKIADFELCFKKGDKSIESMGTPNYRAPEMRNDFHGNRTLEILQKGDIYSAGIILFCMMMGGLPYTEQLPQNYDLYEILVEQEFDTFWKIHEKIYGREMSLDQSFKELFEQMVDIDWTTRADFDDIRSNEWFKGPTYSQRELAEVFKAKNKK